MKRKPVIIALIVVWCIASAVISLWPNPPLDLSHDEEPFRSLAMPPRSVKGEILQSEDGKNFDNVGVIITDNDGVRYGISFPHDPRGILSPCPTAYAGTLDDSRMSQLKDPKRAKRIAIRLLKEYGGKTDSQSGEVEGNSGVVLILSDSIGEKAARALKKLRSYFP
jgi:hypothetical protein